MRVTTTVEGRAFLAIGVALLLSIPLVIVDRSLDVATGSRVLVGLVGAIAAAPLVWGVLGKRRLNGEVGFRLLVGASIAVTVVFFIWVIPYTTIPVDLLAYSEGDYVNDIIKFRIGHPMYTPQVDNAAYVYTPGSQILTSVLASAVFRGTSIATLRTIQLGYDLIAAMLAVSCASMIVEIATHKRPDARWGWVFGPLLFLVTTNRLTNPYTVNLNVDALGQVVFMVGYWTVLRYVMTRDVRWLVVMMVLPGLGFFVKQNQLMWCGIFGGFLLVFDRPRSWPRIVVTSIGMGVGIVAVIGGCYLLWGDAFQYWIFDALKNHHLEPKQSLIHAQRGWAYFLTILVGGVLVLGPGRNRLLAPWLIAASALALMAYTSGIGFHLNHMGPPSVAAVVWLVATIAAHWESLRSNTWVAAAVGVVVILMFEPYDFRLRPQSEHGEEIHRYVNDWKRALAGLPADEVLIDVGAWYHLSQDVLWQDGSVTVGEIAYTKTGDFGPFKKRIAEQRYKRVFVHRLHDDANWYDHPTHDPPTGIIRALLTSYQEIETIEPALRRQGWSAGYGLGVVSVMVPRVATSSTSTTAR